MMMQAVLKIVLSKYRQLQLVNIGDDIKAFEAYDVQYK